METIMSVLFIIGLVCGILAFGYIWYKMIEILDSLFLFVIFTIVMACAVCMFGVLIYGILTNF